MDCFIRFGDVDFGLEPASILQLVTFLAKFGLHEYFSLRRQQLRLAKIGWIYGNWPFQNIDIAVPIIVIVVEQKWVPIRRLLPLLLILHERVYIDPRDRKLGGFEASDLWLALRQVMIWVVDVTHPARLCRQLDQILLEDGIRRGMLTVDLMMCGKVGVVLCVLVVNEGGDTGERCLVIFRLCVEVQTRKVIFTIHFTLQLIQKIYVWVFQLLL